MVVIVHRMALAIGALGVRAQSQSHIGTKCVLLLFLLISAAHSQGTAVEVAYQNFDPPGCGTFHMRRIQGAVTDPTGSPVRGVEVGVFDDVSERILGTTKTDEAGRFFVSEHWQGRLRIVFFSPGFRPTNWAVTITKWPDGGFFRSKTIRAVLELPVGDFVSVCPAQYSRR